jgi:D-arginine dehydrogenase
MTPSARSEHDFDVAIVGGGIAGVSLGGELASERRVVLLEAESSPAMHATGRSAAFWLESYGGPQVAPLTAASGGFLRDPPAELEVGALLNRRGAVHLSRELMPDLPAGVEAVALSHEELERLVPGVRPGWRHALLEPGCADIDVAALHGAFLRKFRRSGGTLLLDARLVGAQIEEQGWTIKVEDGRVLRAGLLVNAAGAWADEVARLAGIPPFGIQPKRRTMVQLRVARSGLKGLPLINDAAGTFYFKGESDRTVWLSPHDEHDCPACDAAPEEIDVAVAIDRFEQVVDWKVEAVERSWAGLRSFAPDRLPVYGFDPLQPAFFWCAGQGGFGIQTAPAAAQLAAALVLDRAAPAAVRAIDPRVYSPARFRT